ncbi:MAG: ThiF family adenylyltransferase [Chloroflexi bacterium]|nr:ThiF family adenylyltransferase [Chloroflexota bacterium]
MKRRKPVEVVFAADQFEWLHEHLFQPGGDEQAAYAFAAPADGPDRLKLLVNHIVPMVREDFAIQNGGYLHLSQAAARRMAEYTVNSEYSLIEIHSHPFAHERVGFSGIDYNEAKPRFAWFAREMPKSFHHVMLVFGTDSADAMMYDPETSEMVALEGVTVLSHPIKRFVIGKPGKTGRNDPYDTRMTRQVQAFGAAGQARVAQTRVGIVGLGGIGSAVAQQLAYLGVREFILMDADTLEMHNLNRFAGGTLKDANRKRRKIDVVADNIRAIDPAAKVTAFYKTFPTVESAAVLKTADVVFGCVDSHGSRLLLNTFAVQYMLPYIDIGVGIDADADGKLTEAGGQYRVVMPGGFCLECVRAINSTAAANDLLAPEQRKVHQQRGYIPSEDIPAPAVVFLNGALTSLAVAEFLNMLTGYRPAQRLTYYFLHDQTMRTVDVSDRRADCAACIPTGRMAQGDLEPTLGLPGEATPNLSTIPKPSDGRPDPAQQPGG